MDYVLNVQGGFAFTDSNGVPKNSDILNAFRVAPKTLKSKCKKANWVKKKWRLSANIEDKNFLEAYQRTKKKNLQLQRKKKPRERERWLAQPFKLPGSYLNFT